MSISNKALEQKRQSISIMGKQELKAFEKVVLNSMLNDKQKHILLESIRGRFENINTDDAMIEFSKGSDLD